MKLKSKSLMLVTTFVTLVVCAIESAYSTEDCSTDCKDISVYKSGGSSGDCVFYSMVTAEVRKVSSGESTMKRKKVDPEVEMKTYYKAGNCTNCTHSCNSATDSSSRYEATGTTPASGGTDDCPEFLTVQYDCDTSSSS